MNVTSTPLDGLLVLEPRCFEDARGFFVEAYQEERYRTAGIGDRFVQDNHSRSERGVLRGLHFRVKQPEAKLLTVIRGTIFDVVVDLRQASSTFGQWFGVDLGDRGPRQIYVPPGFAHGFCVVSDWADVHYKVSQPYDPKDEGGLAWNDPDLAINWPVQSPRMTDRDTAHPTFRELRRDQLPHCPIGPE